MTDSVDDTDLEEFLDRFESKRAKKEAQLKEEQSRRESEEFNWDLDAQGAISEIVSPAFKAVADKIEGTFLDYDEFGKHQIGLIYRSPDGEYGELYFDVDVKLRRIVATQSIAKKSPNVEAEARSRRKEIGEFELASVTRQLVDAKLKAFLSAMA